jgi:hypothetical protein
MVSPSGELAGFAIVWQSTCGGEVIEPAAGSVRV